MSPSKPPHWLLPKSEPETEADPTPLDSIPEPVDGAPPSKRQCISNACEPCRRRKMKCDGAKPSCSACTSVYDMDCYYDLDNDYRRKGAMRREIRQLNADIDHQKTIIDAIRNSSEAGIEAIARVIRCKPHEPLQSIAETVKMIERGVWKEMDGLTRDGTLAEFNGSTGDSFGETMHYGTTSNYMIDSEDEAGVPEWAGDQVGTWTTVTNDKGFVMHLLHLYFAWAHPFYVLFSEETFWHGFNDRKFRYCSPMLLNAVLAVACNFSDRPEARADSSDPTSVGNHFFAEAKRLLDQDDRTRLTTVQALGLMSIRQMMNDHKSSSCAYVGRMMTMSIEMGLHLIYAGPTNKNVTPTEIEIRKITFWGCYILENTWMFCVGRFSHLPQKAIMQERPATKDNLERRIWRPYNDDNSPEYYSQLEQPGLTYTVLLQLSFLSETVNDTVQMLYAPKDHITSDLLQQQHKNFQKWYGSLPEILAVKQDAPTLPHVLAIHIYYHHCIIHLFRPFVRLIFKDGSKSPRTICAEEAVTILQLMKTYSNTYGLRRGYFVNAECIFSAAIIHLLNMSSQERSLLIAIQAAEYLLEAIKMLQEMYAAFPVVARHLKSIRKLASNWGVNLPENIRQALEIIDIPSPPSTSSNSITPRQRLSAESSPTRVNESSSHISEACKHSAPVPLQMPSNLIGAVGAVGAATSELFQFPLWTPFPESRDRLPIIEAPPFEQPIHKDGFNNMLVGGGLAHLNRDGFAMDATDLGTPVWDPNRSSILHDW